MFVRFMCVYFDFHIYSDMNVMVDESNLKSLPLSLEARHSISLEIAKQRRQRFQTSIFMPKTSTKPKSTATENDDKMKSPRPRMTRKPKLQHPESVPVRTSLMNRLQKPALPRIKERINLMKNYVNEKCYESIVPIPDKEEQHIRHDTLGLNLENSTSQQFYVENTEARTANFALEDNFDLNRLATSRESELASLKSFRVSNSVRRSLTPPGTTLRNDLETEHNILRKAIKAANQARNGAIKIFGEDDFSKKALLAQNAEDDAVEYFKLIQMPERYTGGLNPSSGRCEKSKPKAKKVNQVSVPVEPQSVSMRQINESKPVENTLSSEDPRAAYCRQMNPCNEVQLMDPNCQPQDNYNYMYGSMPQGCNYCCVQEEEFTIEQTHQQSTGFNAPVAAAPAPVPITSNSWYQGKKNESRQGNVSVGTAITPAQSTAPTPKQSKISFPTSPNIQTPEISFQQSVIIPASASQAKKPNEPQATDLRISKPIEQQQHQQVQQQNFSNTTTDYQMSQLQEMQAAMSAKSQQVARKPSPQPQVQPQTQPQKSNSIKRRNPNEKPRNRLPCRPPCPPNDMGGPISPWPIADPNCCHQHGPCCGCNVYPPAGGCMYRTCMPWWYPTYQPATYCLPHMYPQMQQHAPQQLHQFYGPVDNFSYYRGRRS